MTFNHYLETFHKSNFLSPKKKGNKAEEEFSPFKSEKLMDFDSLNKVQ